MSFNLNEEVIDGHLVTAETKKLWAVEMDLAKHLLDVCAKYNLKIWATGGTLLGAVRHKGFIPWDDDMDFCMMRNDYDKLVEIGPSEFKEPYFFQSFYTDNFWGGMVKIRRSDTAMLGKGYKYYKPMNFGCAIDVFVMDAIPDDLKVFKKLYNRIRFKRRFLQNYRILDPKQLPLFGKLKHGLITAYVKLNNPIKLQAKIRSFLSENKINNNKECGLIDYSALVGNDISKITLRSSRNCYEETIEMPFHDMMMPIPQGYDEILRRQYGNYMVPVKGTANHSTFIIDCSRSYKDVLTELKTKDYL